MKPRRMEIEFDPDCMTEAQWHNMESDLEALLLQHGWHLWVSGCTIGDNDRTRDIGLIHCPNTQCDSYATGIGCMAESCLYKD